MAYNKTVWKDLPNETTPVNASNLNKIEDELSALDQVANINIVTDQSADLNSYTNEGNYFFGSSSPTNAPESNSYGWLIVLPNARKTIVKQIWLRSASINGMNEYKTFIRLYTSSTWSNWKQVQMGGDSGWLNLPLASGITQYASSDQYKCQYRRIGDVVYVIGCVKGISANNTTIATLPEGYRPVNTYRYVNGRNPNGNSILTLTPSGALTFVGLTQGATIASTDFVYIQTSFLVA